MHYILYSARNILERSGREILVINNVQLIFQLSLRQD